MVSKKKLAIDGMDVMEQMGKIAIVMVNYNGKKFQNETLRILLTKILKSLL